MKKIFGAKKSQDPPPSIQDATDRIGKRGDTVDEKIKKLDAELARYMEQINKTRPGPAQEAVKARAMRVLKQRKISPEEGCEDLPPPDIWTSSPHCPMPDAGSTTSTIGQMKSSSKVSPLPASRFRRVCVFCGRSTGRKASYQAAAVQLGQQLVECRLGC